MSVYNFSGQSDSRTRDKLIREFQGHKDGPACFVMTIKTGSAGITLTNATNVFLIEPCLDPSQEVQAAGRIHRLGQDKPVEVTKYVYRVSLESLVYDMHREIEKKGPRCFDDFFDGDDIEPDAMGLLKTYQLGTTTRGREFISRVFYLQNCLARGVEPSW